MTRLCPEEVESLASSNGTSSIVVKLERVSKVYRDRYAVRDLDLEVREGEFVVLIGPSGCGKTTTLKMINRLVECTSGSIYVYGQEVHSLNPTLLRRKIGYVIQQIGLFPHLTVAQNIELVPRLLGVPKAEREKRVDELLRLVGFEPSVFRGRYPRGLSGGQQQRVGVLRALAANPALILMDEPFGALDPITREQLQDELKRLKREFRKTIVFVTHDMDEALKLADRIVVMREGRAVQTSPPEELLRNPADDFVREFLGARRILRHPQDVQVREIMLTTPVTGTEDMGLAEAFQKMQQHRVNTLLIVDERSVLLGIVTSGGLQKGIREGGRRKLAEFMEPVTVTIAEGENVLLAARLMAENKAGVLPVVDSRKRLKGVITKATLVSTMVDVLWPSGADRIENGCKVARG